MKIPELMVISSDNHAALIMLLISKYLGLYIYLFDNVDLKIKKTEINK